MNIFLKAKTVARVLKWRLTWNKYNTNTCTRIAENPKFMSAREAINLIHDNDVCMVSGLAGNQRISILSWALREKFEKSKSPKKLTLITPGGQGGRGKVPGTLEEWALEGLTDVLISAHHETYRAFLHLADQKGVTLQCIPQGIIALAVAAQSRGEKYVDSDTGLGTFCDPRINGSVVVTDKESEQLVKIQGDKLRYHLPSINIALFNAPAADKEGNIYVKNSATICELKYAAHAARKNGGKVIANVGNIIAKNTEDIYLPADMVDAIVVHPDTEQTGAFPHQIFCKHFTTHPEADLDTGVAMIRLINRVAKITPKRGKKDLILAAITAKLLLEKIEQEASVNIGTGLPEEVCFYLYKNKCLENIRFFTEAGAIGGIPAPGIFFGAAAAPEEIISSPEIFRKAYQHLDATVLGFLEVDIQGNVNASRKHEGAKGFVGPGGFMDFTSAAKNIFFIGSWMTGGKIKIKDDTISIIEYGRPKFVKQVKEITYCATEGLRKKQNVFFITHVGVFALTEKGIQLQRIMPGINIQKDIIDFLSLDISIAADCQQI